MNLEGRENKRIEEMNSMGKSLLPLACAFWIQSYARSQPLQPKGEEISALPPSHFEYPSMPWSPFHVKSRYRLSDQHQLDSSFSFAGITSLSETDPVAAFSYSFAGLGESLPVFQDEIEFARKEDGHVVIEALRSESRDFVRLALEVITSNNIQLAETDQTAEQIISVLRDIEPETLSKLDQDFEQGIWYISPTGSFIAPGSKLR